MVVKSNFLATIKGLTILQVSIRSTIRFHLIILSIFVTSRFAGITIKEFEDEFEVLLLTLVHKRLQCLEIVLREYWNLETILEARCQNCGNLQGKFLG